MESWNILCLLGIRYPDVIDGAIAASAPIWQLADTVRRDTLDMQVRYPNPVRSSPLGSPLFSSARSCMDTKTK